MVRRKGLSYRNIVLRQKHAAKRAASSLSPVSVASSGISALVNYASPKPVAYYGNLFAGQMKNVRKYLQKKVRDFKESRRIARQGIPEDLREDRVPYDELMADDAADNVDPKLVYPEKYSMGKSRYVGNFKKPKPYGNSWVDSCSKQGFVWTDELYGKVADPNSVYLTHSTFNANILANVIAMTWLRKVLNAGGIHMKDRLSVIPFNSVLVGSGARFEYTEQNPVTGVVAAVAYDTVAGETMDSLLTNFATYRNNIYNYIVTPNSAFMPFKLCFYSYDLAAVTSAKYTLSGMLDLDCEVLEVYGTSQIKVQNRTSPDESTGGNQETDRGDIQPIVGTVYNFTADPKVKKIGTNDPDTLKLQGVLIDSIKLNRGAEFNVAYNNRPSAHLFLNCNKKSNVMLQPGDVRRGAVFHTMKGTLKSLMPKIRVEHITGASLAYGVRCSSQMIVFEELIRTAGTNNITVQYERKLMIGCKSYTKRHSVPFVPNLTTGAKNLVPP